MAKEQEQKRVQRREATEAEAQTEAPVEERAPRSSGEALKDEMDAILDEIDTVLEENAEEFVKGYVQKGGE